MVLTITPGVLPFVLPFVDVVTALAAGNAAVAVLPPDAAPLLAPLRDLFRESAGEAAQLVVGGASVVQQAIDAGPDFVAFTGSEEAGRDVAVRCARQLRPSRIHVGGHAPAVVSADADIARTARALVWGAFHLGGRSCVRVARVVVDESIHDELVARMEGEVAALRTSESGGSAEVDVVTRFALPAGTGELPTNRIGDPPNPVLVPDCRRGDAIVADPPPLVLPLVPVPAGELLEAALEPPPRLAAYVFTRDKEKGRQLAEAIPAGMVMVNNVAGAYGTPATPVGVVGVGWGHVHGEEGLREMCHLGQVTQERVSVPREPLWFPYGERAYKAGLKAMRLLYRRGSTVKKILDLF